ncbi:MAG TPA: Hsp20/alpha crystallin family protein [Clostridiales bacterium]|nr:Hsp20/alpha crystallin family protein [Clostridiales bacterium]
MERRLPVTRAPQPWSAIDRFFDYAWDRFYRPLFRLPFAEERDYGVIEPAVDVFETDDHMVVKAELPGMDPKDIEVRVTEDSVAFRGTLREEHEERGEGYHYRERRHGLVQRLIPLARHIDPEATRASFRHGVLTIRAPKVDRERGRVVTVDVESDETGYGGRRLQQ